LFPGDSHIVGTEKEVNNTAVFSFFAAGTDTFLDTRIQIRREVARLNRLRKVVIHTVALGRDADVRFMRGLAEDTGGQFVHIAGRR